MTATRLKFILPALAAALAGVLAFGITRHVVCRAAGPESDCPRNIAFLRRELRLSDTQTEQIAKLHDSLAAKLNDCRTRHCRARMELGRALVNETAGCGLANAALAEMCSAYEDGERATLEHIRRMRAALDPAQRDRFDAMLQACLCRKCAAHDCPEHDSKSDHPTNDARESRAPAAGESRGSRAFNMKPGLEQEE